MPASEQKKPAGIFISYRRSDNPDAVGRIYDRLVSEFGKARVFKDVDSIPLGQDFRGHLNDIVGGCAAVLAIIGPKWTDIRNEAGQKRLEDPDDFVRIELEAALARSVPVVPVLVGHAPMPGTSQLPSTLSSLAFRQSIEVRPDPDFHNDATRLVSALWAIVDPDAPRVAPRSERPVRSWLPWVGALAAVATLAAIALGVPALKHLRETPPHETRIAISLPVVEEPAAFALSPDGRQIVYEAKWDAERRLWLRSLAMTTAQPLPGTGGAKFPVWSPDGRSIAFLASSALKRLDLGSGQPQTLATADVNSSAAIWGAGGDILFNPSDTSALARVAASGGPVTEVTRLYANNTGHRALGFLPDGKHFLFASIRGGKERGTYLGSLDGSPAVHLTSDAGPSAYLPSGWMLIQRFNNGTGLPSGDLEAYRLDVGSATLGKPVTIATGVGAMSASAAGLVAFRSTSVEVGERQLAWRDRAGRELGTIGDPDSTYQSPRVSPDGRHVVVSRGEQGKEDVWLLDGTRTTRVTFEGSGSVTPVWSPDGSHIAYSSRAGGERRLYQIAVNGTSEAQRIPGKEEVQWPTSWTPDGRFLFYIGQPATNNRVYAGILSLSSGESSVLVDSTSRDVWGQVSPDGKWIAYQTNASRIDEIFARPFVAPGAQGGPKAAAGKWQVSAAGGIHPSWSMDGKEIFYINRQGEMMAVPIVVNGSALEPGKPVKLFQTRIVNGGVDVEPGRQYDVARDGRFLINTVLDSAAPESSPIILIQNWNPGAR